MARLTSQGLIDDGSANLTVDGVVSAAQISRTAGALLGSGSSGSAGEAADGSRGSWVTIPGPGFYLVPVTGSVDVLTQRGASGFTGSLPNPAAFPGGDITIRATTVNYDYVITGSMALFSSSAGVGGGINGTKLTVKAGGAVGLKSDYARWIVTHVSGTATLTGLTT